VLFTAHFEVSNLKEGGNITCTWHFILTSWIN